MWSDEQRYEPENPRFSRRGVCQKELIATLRLHLMIQRPRGTRDFGPGEMAVRRDLEATFRRQAHLFGFQEVATPMFERTELFTLKSGPNIVEEIYAFEDKGGRPIALRPELTAPVMRFFVNDLANLPRPLKLFYFGQCFRYERPQSGRYREFFQFGAEVVGSALPETDAEVIALAASMIESTGLREYGIRVGHIGVLRERLERHLTPGEMAPVLQRLDKKMYDDVRDLLTTAGVGGTDIDEIEDITRISGPVDVLEGFDDQASDYLRQVFKALEPYDVMNLTVDLGVVRGLDYYTGMVFEGDAPSLGAEKQIMGGGSYSLTELFGGEAAFTSGFAIGFDRILLAMEREGQVVSDIGVEVFVLPVGDDMLAKAQQVAADLRRNGVSADVDLMRRKLNKSMKYASSIGARNVIVVGERDIGRGEVTVRDMSSGKQMAVRLEDLVALFR